ncbi:hypothetical protein ACIA9I_21685 [Streptomyces anulatus]
MIAHAEHTDRLVNNELPGALADTHALPRGSAGDALAVLALREAMYRQINDHRPSRIREAIELGATWSETAAALETSPDEARFLLREWADRQHRLHQRGTELGDARPAGLDEAEYTAVLALVELGDSETVRGATR